MTEATKVIALNQDLSAWKYEGAQARHELHEPKISQVSKNVTTGVVPHAVVAHDRHDARELVSRRPLATTDALLVDLGDLLPLRSPRLEIDHGRDGMWLHPAWAIPNTPKHA